jgi:N-succinyldiaminopimelate aminotransferase
MNPDLDRLLPYPFERLAALWQGLTPRSDLPHISLAIGEPRHPTPHFITEALLSHAHGLSNYPTTKGGVELREAICDWLAQRFAVPRAWLSAERHVLPVNGTREALFAFAQAMVARTPEALVVSPNPFYQIYEGATLLAGAQPYFVDLRRENGYLPDFTEVPADIWQRCQLIYICSPGNPSGAVMPQAQLIELIELADRYDFVIASDECYSELYQDEDTPPVGLLRACAAAGRDDLRRCVVFHSLSKRSNVPGLRSGFVAGDAAILERFLLYRTYHGCAMPLQNQAASIAAWRDEQHVRDNRALYRQKFREVAEILAPVLDFQVPAAGFYLWPRTPLPDTEFTRRLFAEENVAVLPGSFLSREHAGSNPGQDHVRIALVATPEECRDAAGRIRRFIERL